ncbi:hypothetical protein V1520DRAFT_349784 [Lipomyces starkeyi]|uniref:SH3 domain-containing protein n=1 Tax=Lipomyces starkeyi NRRL Y-11557 TaxID=675824 RepID=A0A1E3PTU3_LIPST|nr:hypothetical protein LIPSTDRAFT_66811 [Lipomyces starkeyi NRRL Y-11557]
MSPQQRHHRHAIHARDPESQIVDEYDFGFDTVEGGNVDEIQIPDVLQKPKMVRRQVLTVFKTLTVTHSRSTTTAVAAAAVDNVSATARSSKGAVTSSEAVSPSSRSSAYSTITVTHSSVASHPPTLSNKSKPTASSSVATEETTSATPTVTEIKSSIATSAAVASSASLVSGDVVPTSTGASTLLTVVVTSSSASSSLASSTLVGSSASSTASSTFSAPSGSSTSLGSSSSFSGTNNNGSTDESPSPSSGSMSTGARAGIAIGAIVAATLIFILAFVLVRRVKQRRQEKNGNEKATGAPSEFSGQGSTAYPVAAHTMTEKPPRLSIRVSRPVSGLLPLSLLSGRATRTSTGALHSGVNGDAAGVYAKMSSPPASIRSSTASDASIKKGVETAYTSTATATAVGSSSPASSYASSVSSKSSGNDSPILVVPAPQDPFLTASATSGAAAGAAAAEAASASTSNVHRAIMDFSPTMHDELALKEGQLVRILHEYDDGWTLCVKLDRSAQGVCPRSCLSARALRPRPKRGVKGADAPPATSSGAMKTSERNITNLPAVNTEAANANKPRPGMAEKLPSTPTIQVFAPDSERPFEIA